MADNDFLPFATEVDANVMSQPDYDALPARGSGFEAGKAVSEQLNKVWRQAAFVASAIAQWMCDTLDEDVLDDGDQAGFIALLQSAMLAQAGTGRIITAAGPANILSTDRDVFVNQAIAAAITLNLPATPALWQEVTVYDDKGDANTYNITVSGNGKAIANMPGNTYKLTQDYMAVTFKYNGTAWRIKCVNF